jgi:Domain of unknown function (DUF4296)
MGMKKKIVIPFLIFLSIFASCEKEVVNTPKNLIEKEKMVDIMYDLSILEAIKIQNASSLDTFKINSSKYIYKKHKIDSAQFAQNNIYYAADYKEYKRMYEEVKSRLDKNVIATEAFSKNKKKKDLLLEKTKKKLKLKKEADSIKKLKQKLKIAKATDSIKRLKK